MRIYQPADHRQYLYSSLGTLCDEPNGLTCSFYVAQKWGQAERIVPYPTFEAAAEDVKRGSISAFLVPGAYPQLGSFIMDNKLVARETFIMQIPALVVAGIPNLPPEKVDVLFHHPATAPLLSEVQINFQRNEFVPSNSKACECLPLQNAHSCIAITNELCLHYYRLNLYQVLRPSIQMPWICFTQA
jgi:hypothetical protein